MNIYKFEYFIRVAELGSITRAAESLCISQQALSKLIHQLEAEYKVPLLSRNSNGVALTEYGRHFLSYALSAVERHERLKNTFQDMQGTARETMNFAYGTGMLSHSLPQLIIDFMRDNPSVDLRLFSYSDDPYNRSAMQPEINLLLSSSPPQENGWNILASTRLPMKVLMDENNPLARRRELFWMDIVDAPMIHLSVDNAMNRRLMAEYKKHGVKPAYTISSAEQYMTNSLMQYFGAVSFFAGDELTQLLPKNMVTVPLSDCEIQMEYYLAVNKRFYLSPAGLRFAESIANELNQLAESP